MINLQDNSSKKKSQIFKEKSPMNKSSLKILKTSMEKSPESKLQRINLLSIASKERSPKQMADCDLLPYSPVVATTS